MNSTAPLLPGLEIPANEEVTAPALPSSGEIRAHVPTVTTRELQLIQAGDRKKIRFSSNFLRLYGFDAGARHSVTAIPGDGLRVTFDPTGAQKIYQRAYTQRRNNPLETLLEIGAQSVISEGIPDYAERLHFSLRHGEIRIRPLPNRTFHIRRWHARAAGPLAAFVAMTGGVDAHCLAHAGFAADTVLEYRPPESRDTRDMTEVNALNVLGNVAPRVLLNESISTIDWNRAKETVGFDAKYALLHVSLQCDDFTNVKAKSLREQAVADGTDSRDLAFDCLRMVETFEPAAVMIEQVPGFAASAEGAMVRSKLRKWGYHVSEGVMRGDKFGGLTRRERYYLVASVFPGFEFPKAGAERTEPVWPAIADLLHKCRDIGHTVSLRKGIEGGRARLLDPSSLAAPTLLKSQNRQAKDSVYLRTADGRYLFPALAMQQRLNGIPDDFHLGNVAGDIASEIIGQSIEYPMHHRIALAVRNHLLANRKVA